MKLNAIDPNFSVWISASAGMGKTKVLVQRILRLLLENRRNILCLTFTNAAANEMENRIHNILSKWAICSKNVLAKDLEQLGFPLTSLNTQSSSLISFQNSNLSLHNHLLENKENESKARRLFSELENLSVNIQTIHAFCYKLITNFPMESGVVPNYILNECEELHSIVFNKILYNKTIQDDINLIAVDIDEKKLKNLLHTLCVKRPCLENNFDYIKCKLSIKDEIHELQNETIISQVKKLAKILSNGSKRDQNYSMLLYEWSKSSIISLNETKSQKRKKINFNINCLNNINIEALIKIFLKSQSNEKKNILSIITKDTLKKFKYAEPIIENIQNIVLTHVRDTNSYQIFKRTSSLLRIFKVYVDLYNNEKSKKAFFDYNDIIDLAVNLLNKQKYKNWILSNLDQKIDHILIDEAQDNSFSHWKIITSLCDEFFTSSEEKKRTLFVVGDVKQSIYRFQGANPYLFKYMEQYFYAKTHGKNWISYQLEKSFRSTPQILWFIDKIFNNFRQAISFADSEIKHIPHRKRDQGHIEIWPLLSGCKKEKQQALQTHLIQKRNNVIVDRLLAQAIAYKICNWLNEGRMLIAKDRHIEPRDIMILVRQKSVLVDYVVSEFKKINIPIIRQDYFRIMNYIVVQDLIALAEFLLLPTNDLALANVLKSPLFNFSEDDLCNIAYDRKKYSLWEKLEERHKFIFNELNYLIDFSRSESTITLFAYIFRIGKKKFAARLGLECFEILDEFMNLVLQFKNPSLQAFVQWIKENNPEIKTNIKSERNSVRIMTIHKSKGLQAPIVFLIDTNTIPKNSESIVFDTMEVPFWCEKNDNTYCNKIKKEKKLEDYNEYLRLLYVALTRAEDELYILGKEPVQKGSWYDILTKYGRPYEKKKIDLNPIFKEKVEVLCINTNYPFVYKKRNYFDVPMISLPPNLLSNYYTSSFQHSILEFSKKKESALLKQHWNNKKSNICMTSTGMVNNYERGLIIHTILQYMPKIEKNRRKNWIREYLNHINIEYDKDEIYNKILAFNEKYFYLFDLKGKSEITINGTINGKSILIRLDRLCLTQDKAIIIDYKSCRSVFVSSLNEIKKQMLTYKTLVQQIYPSKHVKCVIIWIEDLILQSIF
ncbi:MAG: UvrD-helicase domain-containing protein [Wolbachia endosymbiont of Meromenopon meropis]|nr:UvrD-helicase domain-containing protein [Wolbachia endosymbiont of Meromenopon meropis]